MTESAYPTETYAGKHAWRRVSKAIGPGEAKNLAKDIAAIIEVEKDFDTGLAPSIEFALTGFNWETKPMLHEGWSIREAKDCVYQSDVPDGYCNRCGLSHHAH